MIRNAVDLQILFKFGILQKLGFLLDGLFPAISQDDGTLHHFGGLVAYVSAVIFAVLGLLDTVRPSFLLSGGFLKFSDILAEPDVLFDLGLLPVFETLEPCAEITFLYLDVGLVYRKNMIHAIIQEMSVMGSEDKSFFAGKV